MFPGIGAGFPLPVQRGVAASTLWSIIGFPPIIMIVMLKYHLCRGVVIVDHITKPSMAFFIGVYPEKVKFVSSHAQI